MTAYGLAFITGVLGSFHCIGMGGGFPILISGASGRGRNISGQLLYNFGRVFTYFFLGVLVGALGFMIKEMEPMLGFQVGLTVVLGLVIILAGLQMTGLVGEGRIPGAVGADGWLAALATLVAAALLALAGLRSWRHAP